MGQQEVITFLNKNRSKWLTARQVAEKLNISYGSVVSSLKKLRQSKEIQFKIISNTNLRKRKVFAYKY